MNKWYLLSIHLYFNIHRTYNLFFKLHEIKKKWDQVDALLPLPVSLQINVLLFPSFPNSLHLLANFPATRGPDKTSRKITDL